MRIARHRRKDRAGSLGDAAHGRSWHHVEPAIAERIHALHERGDGRNVTSADDERRGRVEVVIERVPQISLAQTRGAVEEIERVLATTDANRCGAGQIQDVGEVTVYPSTIRRAQTGDALQQR